MVQIISALFFLSSTSCQEETISEAEWITIPKFGFAEVIYDYLRQRYTPRQPDNICFLHREKLESLIEVIKGQL